MAHLITRTTVAAVSARVLLLAGVLIAAVSGDAQAQRAIPEDNLAYPVLITQKKDQKAVAMASGFYLTTDSGVYLATAAHVLRGALTPDPQTQKIPDIELSLLSYSKDLPVPRRITITLNLPALKESGAVKLHASHDVAIVRLATATNVATGTTTASASGRTFLPGVMAQENTDGVLGVAMASVKTYDQVLVGNDAIAYGYPTSLGYEPSTQFESDRPLLRKSLVAGLNNAKRTIVVDSPAYPGNSGGPVFQIERSATTASFNLIGMVVSHIPYVRGAVNQSAELALVIGTNSGYAVVEPMDFVLELINQDVADAAAARVAATAPAEQPRIVVPASQVSTSHAVSRPPPKGARKTPASAKHVGKPRRVSRTAPARPARREAHL